MLYQISFLSYFPLSLHFLVIIHLTIFNQVFRTISPSKLPSSYRKCLARRANGDGSVPHAWELCHANHLVIIKDHMLIDIITDHENIMFLAKITDLLDFLATEHLTKRIVGVVEYDGFSLGVEDLFKFLWV